MLSRPNMRFLLMGSNSYTARLRATRLSNLLGYWPLRESGGLNAIDISGHNRPLSLNGTVTLGQPGIGDSQTAMDFDGSSAYLANTAAPWELGAEIVANGGFETFTGTVDDGINDTVTSWTNVNGGDSVFQVLSTGYISNCLKIGGSLQAGLARQARTVTAGQKLGFCFWTQGDGVNAGRYKVYDNSNAANIIALTSTAVTAATWAYVRNIFTVPAGCTSINLDLFQPSPAASYALFDEISLRPVYDFSVAFWVKRNGANNVVRQYLVNRYSGTINRLWSCRFLGTTEGDDPSAGKVRWFISQDGTDTGTGVSSTTIVNQGQWYHVLATFQVVGAATSVMTLYINGAQEAQITNANAPIYPGSASLRIAATAVVGSEHYALVDMAHVAMWNTLLTANDAKQLARIH